MYARWIRALMVIAIILIAHGLAICETAKDLPLAKTPVRFAIIGDRTGSHVPGIYEEIVAEMERLKPDFVITVGDMIEGYTDDTATLNTQWREYFAIVKPLTMPIYFTPGNHDITTDAALGTYRQKIGEPYYSFNVRNLHFVVLDVSRWEASDQLPKAELDWLAKDLADNRSAAQTLVFFHKPFWYNSTSLDKRDTLHSLFVANGVDAVFNGHFHSYFSARIDGILYTAIGSSGGGMDTIPGELNYQFAWVTADENQISIAPIKLGSVMPWDQVTASDLHLVDETTQNGLKFTNAVMVAEDLRAPTTTVQVELDNRGKFPLDDTIRWQVPAGWSIQPASEHVTILAGEKKQISFQASCSGKLYPRPTIALKFPYKEGKSVTVSRDLRISRTALAQSASKSPMLDGKLNDDCWRIPISKLFVRSNDPAPVESTAFYFAYDRDNLYIAAHCRETKMDSLRASVTQRDGGIFGEDCVGFFLQPDRKIDTIYQIYFNPKGLIFDQKISRGAQGFYNGDKSWNGAYTVKSERGKDYWNVEVRIPLAQLRAKGVAGQTWGINFLRKQKRLNNATDWQPPIDYDPQTFGVLQMK